MAIRYQELKQSGRGESPALRKTDPAGLSDRRHAGCPQKQYQLKRLTKREKQRRLQVACTCSLLGNDLPVGQVRGLCSFPGSKGTGVFFEPRTLEGSLEAGTHDCSVVFCPKVR